MSTHNIPLSIYKENHEKYPKYNNVYSNGMFRLGPQERVRNSRGKRAISVRATEVQLYFYCILHIFCIY